MIPLLAYLVVRADRQKQYCIVFTPAIVRRG